MNTCPIFTMKLHSNGDKYSPELKANGRFQLVSATGNILVGYRGNPYNFASAENAKTWLKTNLARFKNSGRVRPDSFIINLHEIYADTQAPEVLADIQAISDYEHELWDIVEEFDQSQVDWDLLDVDGGNAAG